MCDELLVNMSVMNGGTVANARIEAVLSSVLEIGGGFRWEETGGHTISS